MEQARNKTRRLSRWQRFRLWVDYDVPWTWIGAAWMAGVFLLAIYHGLYGSPTGNKLSERDDPDCVRYSFFASSC